MRQDARDLRRPLPPEAGERAKAEARIYIRQLKRLFPIDAALEGHVSYQLQRNQHDSVDYYLDVQLVYDNVPAAIEYATHVEDNLPEYWDQEAKTELEALKQQAAS